MFYSVDLLRMRKNRKGRIPACWLAATIKDFVGSGKHKLSKADLEKLDVQDACDDILEGVVGNKISNRFSLYLSSQLNIGALKIFRQQVKNLEEACEILYTNIMKGCAMSNKQISSKKLVDEVIEVQDTEMEALDLTYFFPENEEDKHLIQEELPILVESGLEFPINDSFADDIRRFPSNMHVMEEVTFNKVEEIFNEIRFVGEEKVTNISPPNISIIRTPGTPKRIYDNNHDATPKKKFRSLSSSSNPSESAKSPVTPRGVRRSIFNVHDISRIMDVDAGAAISGCVPMNEEAADSLSNAIEPRAEEQAQISVRLSLPIEDFHQLPTHQNVTVDENIAPPQISDESFGALSISGPSLLTTERSSKRLRSSLLKSVDDKSQKVQQKKKSYLSQIHLNEELQAENLLKTDERIEITLPVEKDTFQLPELDESLNESNNSQRKKRSKNKTVFDRTKQINIIEPKTHFIYTKFMSSSRPSINDKILANDLLRLPSLGMKVKATLNNNNRCSWGKNLQNLFFEIISKCPIVYDTYQETTRKVANVNKSIRFSDFKRDYSSSVPSSSRHTSSKSGNITSLSDRNQRDEDSDMILMPPPLPVPMPPSDLLANVNDQKQNSELLRSVKSSDSSEQHTPGSPRKTIETTDGCQQHESLAENQSKHHLEVHGVQSVSESDESFLPKLQRSESTLSLQSSHESEFENEDLIIPSDEFYQLLIKMWTVVESCRIYEDELIAFELNDILTPGDASVQELIIYFIYCYELENKHKLLIRQDVAYGPVYIIKV